MPERITKPMMHILERAFAGEVNRALGPASMSAFPIQLGKSKAVRQCVEEYEHASEFQRRRMTWPRDVLDWIGRDRGR